MENVTETTGQGTATSPVQKQKRTRKPSPYSATALKAKLAEAKEKIKELEGRAPVIQVKPSTDETVTFFTEMDLGIDKEGKTYVKNAYPLHYNDKVRQDLVNEIDRLETSERDAMINPNLSGHLGQIKEQLAKARGTLDKMEEVKEKIRINKDTVSKVRNSLGEKIRESMPKLSAMMNRTADAHDEAMKMTTPCIELTPQEAGIAKRNGIRVSSDRKVSRTEATMLWQYCGNALGETRDAETLRRD